jgi:hypothetical protein
MTLSPFLWVSALRPSTLENERKGHNLAIKKAASEEAAQDDSYKYLLFYLIAVTSFFAFLSLSYRAAV